MTFTSETYALIGVAFTLFGVTWKFSAITTKLSEAFTFLERKNKELEDKIKNVDAVPQLTSRVQTLENAFSASIPKMREDIIVLQEARKFSKEMHKVMQQRHSRPDTENNDD